MVKRTAHRLPHEVEQVAPGRFVATDRVLGLSAEGVTAAEADELLEALWKPRFDSMSEPELDDYMAQCESFEYDMAEEDLARWRGEARELRRAGGGEAAGGEGPGGEAAGGEGGPERPR